MVNAGKAAARKLTHARILLKADEAEGGPAWPDDDIAEALGVRTVDGRPGARAVVEQGTAAALVPKPTARAYERKLDGAGEARLFKLACSAPPDGRKRWTLRLLADRMVVLGHAEDGLSYETVRRALKKNALKPWLKRMWCIPPDADCEFVAAMEDVLEVYHRPKDPRRPQVCMDEAGKQLVGEIRAPIPAAPGRPARYDSEYVRNGTANLFVAFEPLGGWRRVEATDGRRRTDWAWFVKDLVDGRYRDADKVVLVMDNLNTHTAGSLYEAFEPDEARRIAAKLEVHYTPKHGSWLNMAEIELSVLSRQCLDRRIADKAELRSQVAAWQAERNRKHCRTDWQFTAADARVKLKRLYPSVKM
ncbi:MAG TPA: IS630 family transposase [Tepidisphaeraceae bacterium]|nr:IS630 family transposase [Tepidisphaeraceae bacterium]